MKPKEFDKLKSDFEKEQKYWESLKIGDIIYDEQTRYFDIDYHKMVIDSINIEKREVVAHDVDGTHRDTLQYFLTKKEFKKLMKTNQ